MSKYEPLRRFLRDLDETRVTVTFAEIERILEAPLPPSAFRHAAWWANNPDGHSHARAWTELGWRTAGIDLESRHATFERVDVAPATTLDRLRQRLRGSATLAPGVDLTTHTDMSWDAECGPLHR